jgi:hypothetical protein
VKVGDEIQARVIKVDKTERRIGLSIKAANYSEEDIKKEAAAFDSAIKPGTELVGLEQAFAACGGRIPPGRRQEEVRQPALPLMVSGLWLLANVRQPEPATGSKITLSAGNSSQFSE